MLSAVLATGLLAGCGSGQSDERADDPGATPSASSSPAGDGPVEFTEVALVSQSAVDGEVDTRATVLDGPDAVDEFSLQFTRPSMGEELAAEVARADVPEGQTLVGAVVSIGCDVPPGVTVESAGDGVAIVAQKVASPLKECFAAVTTVALVAVDSDLV